MVLDLGDGAGGGEGGGVGGGYEFELWHGLSYVQMFLLFFFFVIFVRVELLHDIH